MSQSSNRNSNVIQSNNGNDNVNQNNIENGVNQYNVEVKGDNIIVTTPKGNVIFTKVYNTNNTYQWKLNNEERTRLSKEIVDGILNVFLGKIGNMENDIQEIKKSLIVERQNKEKQEEEDYKKTLLNELDSLQNVVKNMSAINHLLEDEIKIKKHDKATWPLAIFPGVRQYQLGYKTNAYIYWGACFAALGSKGLALKYNCDYKYYIRKINETNDPNIQDSYFKKMDDAKRSRDVWNGAFYGIGSAALVVNLIDALFITNRSKVLKNNFNVSPVVGDKYSGASITYNF